MTVNHITEKAWDYHESTKHSYLSVRNNPHSLDFANQPLPFKIYPTFEPVRMPTEVRQTGVAALSAISSGIAFPGSNEGESAPTNLFPSLDAIAQLLYLSAGITRQRKYPGGEIYFRAAACTGALYEVELYLICKDLVDLAAGVYHFAPAEFGLRQLRAGDYREVLVEATGNEPAVAHAPLTIVCTCTYWRNAWKYQARTYRHFGWDNGTLLANMLAVATALGLPAKVVCGFVDATVNRLLDLDSEREVAFSMVALGYDSNPLLLSSDLKADMVPLGLETVPLSRDEIDYPLMREMHAASSLESAEEVAAWREGLAAQPAAAQTEDTANSTPSSNSIAELVPLSDAEMPRDPIEQVILRRGSSRRFARTPITKPQLSTILDRATRGVPADFLNPMGSQLNSVYLIAHAVEGLEAGAYVFHRDRGYRAVQLEAGILGGRIYLAAYAQRLGATGLTFYDDDVTRFFSPHAEGKSAIFLVAVGHSVKQKSA